MSPRSDRDRRRGGSPRARQAAVTTGNLLAAVARVILLAIMVGAALRALGTFVEVVVRPSSLGSFAKANSYVAFALVAVATALILALALNSSYLPDRLFAPRRLGLLFAAVCAIGAGAILVGLLGSIGLGAYVAVELLPAAMAFALMGLVSPGLFRRPARPGGEPGRPGNGPNPGDDRPTDAHRDRSRQRRGGRGRR